MIEFHFIPVVPLLALKMKKDFSEMEIAGWFFQQNKDVGLDGMHPFEPCLSEKLSTTELLGETWFESWCGTLLLNMIN